MTRSSLIVRALYFPDEQRLDLMLGGGRRYRYSDVPATVAEGLRDAESMGRFYNARIRNRFPCREIGATPRRRPG